MNSELYQKLFDKLDSLSAIRKDLTLWCEVYSNEYDTYHYFLYQEYTWYEHITVTQCISHIPTIERWNEWELEIIWHQPVLTDCLKAINESSTYVIERINWIYDLAKKWNYNFPLLSEQSDELGEYLLTLLV